jgi:hypothetical protein
LILVQGKNINEELSFLLFCTGLYRNFSALLILPRLEDAESPIPPHRRLRTDRILPPLVLGDEIPPPHIKY